MGRASRFLVALLLLPACGSPGTASTDDSSTGDSTLTDSGSSTTMGMGSTESTTEGSTGTASSTQTTTDAMTDATTDAMTDATSETDGTSGPSTTGTEFLQPIDDMFHDSCTTWDDNCPEGQKCMPYANDGGASWNDLACFDIMGSGTVGDPCTVVESGVSGLDDCAQGHMCWDIDPNTLMGNCVAFCSGSEGDPYCEPEMTKCVISGDGTLTPCLPTCDVLVQDCNEGQACYVINDSTSCEPIGAPQNQGNEGQPCEFINGCQAGLMCVSSEYWPGCEMNSGCCAPYCDLNNPMCSEPGTECVALFENDPEPWMENYGVCAIPE